MFWREGSSQPLWNASLAEQLFHISISKELISSFGQKKIKIRLVSKPTLGAGISYLLNISQVQE